MKAVFLQSTIIRGGLLALSLFAANCSGKTYSTFLQPFDIVFGKTANSSVNGGLTSATPLTNTRVMVTFSKPVSPATGQLLSNYRITDANGNLLNILAASRDPNNSNVIFIDTIPQTSGGTYTITATNIVFADGSAIGSGNSASFTAPNNADQTGPAFSSVTALGQTSVEVYFNEAVEKTSAETATNYDLYTNAGCTLGNVNVTGATRDSVNFAKVTLTSAAMTSGTTYYLCATTSVRDIWGNGNTATIASQPFVYTAPVPKVTSAVSTSPTSLLVTFDQQMSATGLTTAGNYTFSGCGTLATSGSTTVTALNNNTQVLLTTLTAGTAGTCTVTVNTAIGSAMGAALTATTNFALFGYTASAATDTTAPSVVSVAATNATTITVTFSEAVTGVTTSDFNLSPSLNITNVSCTGNVCTLTTDTQSTTGYSLSITNNAGGIQDTATPANTLSSGSTSFTGDGAPYIVAIYPVDSGTVLVEWSEPIGLAGTVGAADYTIAGATITGAALYLPDASGRSRYVQLTISPVLTSGTSYTLSVNNPTGSTDSTGNGTLGTVPNGGAFTGPAATTAPEVTSGSSPSATVLVINFNEPLNNSTIATGDFALSGTCGGLTVSSATQVQAGVVQLVLAAGAAGSGNCTVTVGAGNVADLAGNTIAATNNSATFTYTGTATVDTTPPTVLSIVALSNTQVRVFFSEAVATGGGANAGDNTANYSFSPALVGGIASASCTSTYCTLTLNAPGTSAVQYGLTVSNIQDTATPTANTMASQSVSFSGIGSSVSAPTLFMAALINSTTVELTFSEQMALTAAQTTTNYTVSGGNSVSAAVLQGDTTKVRLTISPGAYGSSNSYTVTGGTGLTDTAGNALGTPNSATFTGSATAPAATTLAAASDTGTVGDNITGAAFPSPGLQFTGTTTANTIVYLYDDGVLVATATSNASGSYTVTLSSNTTVGQGSNVFTVATVGPTGLVSDISPSLTITYDSVAPGQPTNVTSNLADGTYGIGQVVDVRVTFPEAVLVTGTPQLTLSTGTPATTAINYSSGSGTTTLVFNYTVVSGNTNADLNYASTNALALNGGTIGDAAGNAAALTLPGLAAAGSLATNKNLNINGVVSGAITYDQSGNTAGPFRTGTVTITATYASAPGSTPTIAIDQQGTNDIAATAMTGGPNVFTYTYTVNAAGGANADGTATITLSTPSVPATPTFIIDTTNPSAPAGITPPAYSNSTTATGVTYTNSADANFSTHNVRACTSNDCATGCLSAFTDAASPVDVSGLSNGTAYYICIQGVDTAGNMSAYVASGTTVTVDTTAPSAASGVSVPTYTQATNADVTFTAGTDTNITTSNVRMCTANDCTTGCVGATTGNSPTNVASLVDGTAYYGCVQSRDLAGNTASWVASAATVKVDTTNPTAPTGVTVPGYSSSTSAAITFTAGTDTNITTSNVKMCTANDCSTGCVGATTGNSPATISGLSSGSSYYGCVQSRDLSGRTSAWVASAAPVVIDTTAPTAASGVTVPTWSTTTSAAISFTAGTDTNITTSNLKLCTANDCSTGCVGATTGNSGTSVGSLVAGTAYYGCVQSRDLAGNTAAWVASAATVTVDTTAPTVTNVTSSTSDGTYGIGQIISIQVTFSESVTVTGFPQLTLETGTTDAVVNYSSGSPGTTLTFNYTVAAGHTSSDLDYVANNSLQYNGGTIVDAAGNAATLTLPDPGQPNSLGANKQIVISTPSGPQISSAEYYDTDSNGKIDHVKITFDKNIDDATMDGYNSSGTPTNQLHNVTTVWSVAGYSNVRLDTRDVINNVNPADNGTNDTVIWLAFDELGGNSYDTGVKPNLLATDSGLKGTAGVGGCYIMTSSTDCSTQTAADVVTASVVETDKAAAIIIGATGVTTSQFLTITFSEPVDASNDGSCSGMLSQLDIQYNDTSAAGVDALDSNSGNWSNTNACDDNAVAARLMDAGVGANLDAGSINSDTVNPASGRIYDVAGNVSLTTPTRVVTGAVAPYVVSVTATGARKIRITFSEAVVNAQATVLGNYTLIENPTESGCAGSGSDAVALTGTVSAISTTIYELSTDADQCSTTTYRLTASTSITDVNEGLAIATPAFGTFLGNERLKISSATCLSTTSFKIVFNKAVASGSGSGGAESTSRYKVTGPISLGAFSSATRGSAPNDNEVTIIHAVEQTGSAFTAIGSNAVNGDGFDDVAAGTIQSSDLTESLQQSPRDRAGFSGCGTAIDNFNQGPITSNPFGDGTDAGNVVSYDSKIYVGTNNNGNSVARFNPDGSSPTLAQFEFSKDTNAAGGGTHANSATTRDGSTAVPPYVTLGYSGCTTNNANQNGGCGPDNEDGRGTFAVGTLGSTKYLFVGGSRSTANFDYIYYTADTDSTLNWNYIDMGTITGSATQGLQSMAVMGDRVYAGMAKNNSGGPNNLPDFGKVNFSTGSTEGDCTPGSTCDATGGTNGVRIRIDYMPYFGGASAGGTTTGMNYAFIVGVDSMILFNNRLYLASGGYHQVDHNGTIIRSNNSNPIACSAVNTCADWTEIGPRSNAAWFNSPTNDRFSIQLTKIANIFPYDKAFAQFAEFNGRLYVTRTVCSITNGALAAAQTAAPAADSGCTDGTDTNRRAQLWKCDPASTGNATECDAADWSIVGDDSTGVTNMGISGNRSMTMVVANGSYLYVGYDNSSGIQVWRTNTANPGSASSSWSQIGGNGLGDATNMLNIYSATSVQQGSDYFIYVAAGKSGQPLAVYRQKN